VFFFHVGVRDKKEEKEDNDKTQAKKRSLKQKEAEWDAEVQNLPHAPPAGGEIFEKLYYPGKFLKIVTLGNF
jgi:hypothetical protein